MRFRRIRLHPFNVLGEYAHILPTYSKNTHKYNLRISIFPLIRGMSMNLFSNYAEGV